METSWVLSLWICQKHLTLLVTRAFLISCRFMELTIRSFIGILIICFLERNQSNSEVFCHMPNPYFREFHREVYWDCYCLLSILMMRIRSSVNLSHHLCGYAPIFVQPEGGEPGHMWGIWLFRRFFGQSPHRGAPKLGQIRSNIPTLGK